MRPLRALQLMAINGLDHLGGLRGQGIRIPNAQRHEVLFDNAAKACVADGIDLAVLMILQVERNPKTACPGSSD